MATLSQFHVTISQTKPQLKFKFKTLFRSFTGSAGVFDSTGQVKISREGLLSTDFQPVTGTIAQGAQGKLILVKRKSDGRIFATKTLFRMPLREKVFAEYAKRCQREYFCAVSVSRHPNVLRTDDMVFDDKLGQFVLVMEFAKGGNIAKAMEKGLLKGGMENVKEWSCLWKQTVAAVAHMHEVGFVHQDIKWENVVWCPEIKTVKLIDFGTAFPYVDPATGIVRLVKGAVGTKVFMAPETYGDEPFDARYSDVYSLGILLAILASPTHSPPWPAAVSSERAFVTWKTKNELPASTVASLPADGVDLLQKMLCVDPTWRINIHDLTHHPFFRSIICCTPSLSPRGEAFSPHDDLHDRLRAKWKKAAFLSHAFGTVVGGSSNGESSEHGSEEDEGSEVGRSSYSFNGVGNNGSLEEGLKSPTSLLTPPGSPPEVRPRSRASSFSRSLSLPPEHDHNY